MSEEPCRVCGRNAYVIADIYLCPQHIAEAIYDLINKGWEELEKELRAWAREEEKEAVEALAREAIELAGFPKLARKTPSKDLPMVVIQTVCKEHLKPDEGCPGCYLRDQLLRCPLYIGLTREGIRAVDEVA